MKKDIIAVAFPNGPFFQWLSLLFLINVGIIDSTYASLPSASLHPILLKSQECQRKNPSTIDMEDCIKTELGEWEGELNKAYKQLMGGDALKKPEIKEALKRSQVAWLSFRDKEFKFLRSYYSQEQGTLWGMVCGRMLVDIVKDRVKELYKTLESVDMSGESSKNYRFDEQT